MATYGEFIDAVIKTKIVEAQCFMEDWMAMATEEQWAEYRPMELTKELVLALAEDMAKFFRESINGICTDALYTEVIHDGHAFLKEIHSKAVELGVDVALEEIDALLTVTEALVASGAARVVPHGE